jgi:hypothetical protein
LTEQITSLNDKKVFSKTKLIELYNEAELRGKEQVSEQIRDLLKQRGELDSETGKTLSAINIQIGKYNKIMAGVVKAEEQRVAQAQKELAGKLNTEFIATGKMPNAESTPSTTPAAAAVAALGSTTSDRSNVAFNPTSSSFTAPAPKITIDKVTVQNTPGNPLSVKETATGPLTVTSDQLGNELKQLVELDKSMINGITSFNTKLDSMLAKMDTLNSIQERIMKAS